MFRNLLVFICLLTIGCATSSGPENKKRSALHTQIGTSLLTNGKFPEALGELLKAVELDPENAIAHNNIALIYLFRERHALAESHLQSAIRLQPSYTEAKNNLGRVYIESNKFDNAIKILKEATADLTYTEPQKTYGNLGLAYFKKGEFPKALEAVEKSLQFDRNRCMSLNLYGRVLYGLKNYQSASASFDQAIDKCQEKGFAEPHYYSAMSYLRAGRTDLARSRFEDVVKLFPTSSYGKKAVVALNRIK
jgi:type IV pilus assembly protein PilF